MTNPANPLDNKAAIEQINQAINSVVVNLIRPNAQQIESNARAIEATNEGIGELRNTVNAFIQKLDDEGLKVTLVTDVADDVAGEAVEIEKTVNNHSAAITALRQDAIADRQAWQENFDRMQSESNQRFEAQLSEIRAQGEQIRALLSALATTNGRVDQLEQAS